MSVQARFYVASTTRFAYNQGGGQVKLQAACRGEENKSWSSATPSGEVTMMITNPDAAEWFNARLGKDIAITFDDRPEDELAAS